MEKYEKQAVDALVKFRKVWCEKKKGTYAYDECPFRCSNCKFQTGSRCSLKIFLYEMYKKYGVPDDI